MSYILDEVEKNKRLKHDSETSTRSLVGLLKIGVKDQFTVSLEQRIDIEGSPNIYGIVSDTAGQILVAFRCHYQTVYSSKMYLWKYHQTRQEFFAKKSCSTSKFDEKLAKLLV